MKTLLILLLFTMTAYSAPPDHAKNPDGDDMPDQASCIFCDDDEPEPEPEPETPMKFDPMSALAGIGFAAFVMSIYKPKKHS